MALATYAELQDAVADWLNRSDLLGAVPTFIRLGEAQSARMVKHWRQEARAAGEIDSRFTAFPPDWRETIRFELVGVPASPIILGSDATMSAERARSGDRPGKPALYCHSGGAIEVFPTPERVYQTELVYRAKLPALSDQNPTNWLLDEAPDVYLYGSLIASAPYLKDDPRIAVWQGLYDTAVNQLNAASEAATTSGTGLRLHIRGTA